MQEMVEEIDKLNFEEIKNKAHKIKGSSGYVSAGRVYYACYFI